MNASLDQLCFFAGEEVEILRSLAESSLSFWQFWASRQHSAHISGCVVGSSALRFSNGRRRDSIHDRQTRRDNTFAARSLVTAYDHLRQF